MFELRILSVLIVIFGAINLLRMAFFLIGSDIYNLLHHIRRRKEIHFTPSFSVIIPAHNEDGAVIRAVLSVIYNKYPKERLEVTVVDDGSTDKTADVVMEYIKNNPKEPVRLIRQSNHGKAYALNAGIKNSHNELVMCLDADSMLETDALKKAALYFSDPRTAALASNVKIIKRKGILNLIQRYEYLVCCQMKRAESLFNVQYIVGGIGSVFRRSVLEKVGYYDTNTVTEDIDLTMKILKNGNKNYLSVYGADVVSYTEAVLTLDGLVKQRYRWKWGRSQTFLKRRKMFFSRDKRYSKGLTWFYLPFAIYSDVAYFVEPVLVLYIIFISVFFRNPISILSAFLVVSSYVMFNILAENTISFREKIVLLMAAPTMYFLFYILSAVEYIALMKSLRRIHKLPISLTDQRCDWVHVERPVKMENYGLAV